MLLTPQRYDFSSKSQHLLCTLYIVECCCWHHKGTIFQANHNVNFMLQVDFYVVVDTTKVRFFKQITTYKASTFGFLMLLLTPQRYDFSSKSQLKAMTITFTWVVVDTTKVRFFKQITTYREMFLITLGCCWHHKGTIFQANHNPANSFAQPFGVVVDTTKVRFFKQITTLWLILY